MTTITKVEVFQVDLAPPRPRTDAIQSFDTQETPIVRIRCDDGSEGTGYSYTIGTGGSSVLALLRDHLLPQLIGMEPQRIEHLWRTLYYSTHATAVGAITSLAMAAIDTALWDWRCRRDGQPLWVAAGGAQHQVPVYTTEGGWLHYSIDELVEAAVAVKNAGFLGAKIKVGKRLQDDLARLAAVRETVGDDFELMIDANQCFTPAEAIRRAPYYAAAMINWFEEPLPADDLTGHARLAASTRVPVAVGESLYSIGQFADYLRQGACAVVQTDVARIGGITPWLKVAHMAEACNVPVCPHFLMELHVSLCAAVPNAEWLEFIPQLDSITRSLLRIEDGHAYPPSTPGLGIDWDWHEIERRAKVRFTVS